jgi:hypothetical protein
MPPPEFGMDVRPEEIPAAIRMAALGMARYGHVVRIVTPAGSRCFPSGTPFSWTLAGYPLPPGLVVAGIAFPLTPEAR